MTKKKQENQEPIIKELLKKPTGRETKLNKEIIEEILSYLKLGFSVNDTCEAVGITKQTFFRWKKQGKADKENGIKSDFCDFCDSIKTAKHSVKKFMLSKIVQTAKEKWEAAAWWLERNFPEDYSLKPELRTLKNKSKTKNVESNAEEIINKLNEKFDD